MDHDETTPDAAGHDAPAERSAATTAAPVTPAPQPPAESAAPEGVDAGAAVVEAGAGDGAELDGVEVDGEPTVRTAAKKRRRGSRGGRNRKKPAGAGGATAGGADDDAGDDGDDDDTPSLGSDQPDTGDRPDQPEMPERISENRPSAAAADAALVRKPQIGDTRPAPPPPPGPAVKPAQAAPKGEGQRSRQRTKVAQAPKAAPAIDDAAAVTEAAPAAEGGDPAKKRRRRGGKGRSGGGQRADSSTIDMDPDVLERRRGRERNGRPVGRYLMCVQVRPTLTQVAVLEGRNLIEHYVSRPSDDISQIHGNIYVGKVQNVLPGMEAAFVDIGTPKNAVLYRGDVQYNEEDIVEKSSQPRIEQMLKPRQLIVCQVTKNPIGAKGARLTQEVSLPGRFVVLIPNSKTYGISKRLPDDVRKRLRNILDRVKPAEHGLIVRTAAEHATEHELRADMTRLLDQWNAIDAKAKKANGPTLLYREPELAVRVIREEFNAEYRGIVIDDQRLFDDVRDYVGAFNPELADRVEHFDAVEEGLPLYERFHIHEQLHKALDRKVWLPSGGSLIIEHTEALTVIDVNTGKNVGTTNLEETVFKNNLEAAEEVAKQLRLRDIGGIVVIDFIDMEIKENRRKVVEAFRAALARDKTRTQVFDISELGLVEMTRKRIGEGLLVNFADQCPNCQGRGVVIDHALLE